MHSEEDQKEPCPIGACFPLATCFRYILPKFHEQPSKCIKSTRGSRLENHVQLHLQDDTLSLILSGGPTGTILCQPPAAALGQWEPPSVSGDQWQRSPVRPEAASIPLPRSPTARAATPPWSRPWSPSPPPPAPAAGLAWLPAVRKEEEAPHHLHRGPAQRGNRHLYRSYDVRLVCLPQMLPTLTVSDDKIPLQLENTFNTSHYPDVVQRELLAKRINLKEERIEVRELYNKTSSRFNQRSSGLVQK